MVRPVGTQSTSPFCDGNRPQPYEALQRADEAKKARSAIELSPGDSVMLYNGACLVEGVSLSDTAK